MGALPDGVLHPFVGLFNGTIKSAAIEMRDTLVLSVFTSSRDSREAVRQAETESSAKQLLPAVVLDGAVRKTFLLRPAPAALDARTPARLGRDSVVVATAGARGITAELLKTIARHFKPRLYLIGSNRLEGYPADVFEGEDEEFAKRRPAYLRERKAADPALSVAAASREFDRMVAARTSRRNIAEMERHCGKGAVHYLACDVLDRERLASLLSEVVRSEGKIDLVINSAGLNRSSSIPVKSFADFRAVRDLKLRGYQNLRYALRSALPRMWCNFGSFIGLTGQAGETDYASGNDFLTSAAAFSARRDGIDEYTIGWTLWSTVGLGSHPVFQTFLEKSGLYTKMTTHEGIHHFVREVNCASHPPSVVYMGPAEKAALTAYIPDYFAVPERPAAAPDLAPAPLATADFYLGSVLSRSSDDVTFERVVSLDTDPYLRHHVVNGYPTLPGTFVTEIAAEAASHLAPGWKVVALQDAAFSHFLRVYDRGRAAVKKIHARVVERRDDQLLVHIRVLTDVTGPNGRVLVKDKQHFAITAVMRGEYPSAPVWECWTRHGEVPVPDPYHFANAPVALTDMFVSTRDTRVHPWGKRATWQLNVADADPVFSRFLVPTILLDGLARIAVLNFVHGDFLPLVAPASIRRIDFYEPGNDCELWRKYGPLDLYSTPRDFRFDEELASNRFVAARADGTMVVQMKDVAGVVVGYVRAGTGEFVSPEQVRTIAAVAGTAGDSIVAENVSERWRA
jgi:NAD(P)-dependent dehydrogenase (short-subunit alcohol dehydrogenase family)